MLKRLLSTVLFIALFVPAAAFAQTGSIEGTVTDQESGEPLPGVNIFIVETEQGAATNAQGEYSIDGVEEGTYTLRATYVGYNEYEEQVTVDGTTSHDIVLNAQTQELDDVVVTAFGLNREERSLSYSVQEVSGENLEVTGSDDLIDALGGTVSGVQIVGSPGAAIGGSSKIRIRGNTGLSTSDPLFVVDGTPISNESFQAENRDLGSLAQDLNIDDVESISVLKGASAAAMYGNRASDGVVVITTKGGQVGERPFQVEFSNTTSLSEVYVLPDYQNQYAGGYTQSFVPITPNGATLNLNPDDGNYYRDFDSETESYSDLYQGEVQQRLNYAADESWGPPIEGQEYRPWYSWYHGDFTGDGQDDYGTTTTLDPQPDNVRNFYDTGVNLSNSLAISGGAENSAYRVSIEDVNNQGVMPNSSLDKTFLNFNGSLQHSDRVTSQVTFNYINTQTEGQPAQSYSPLQGNPTQAFNQWFQRQLDMEKLENYRLNDGTLTTWNIQSPTNPTPLYWNSPYFSVMENINSSDRDRVYGNYSLTYNLSENLQVAGTVHADLYDFQSTDRIASGGLETDWYSEIQRNRREMNYEGSLQYQRDFQDWSFDGYLGANLRQERYDMVDGETVGGLAVPNLFNLEASADRPNISNFTESKDVRSVYGTANIGWRDLLYADITLRNDWSSALPEDNNSYLYYGFSGSLVFTEFDAFNDLGFLTFGKLRASYAQVGDDLDPYQIYNRYFLRSPRGSYSAMTVPDLLNNPDLKAAIKTDTEIGLDLRFLDGRLRLDANYYRSISEDEILQLQVSPASGYGQSLINAGKFTQSGLEFSLGGEPFQAQDWNLDLSLNWSTTLTNEVNELAPQLDTRLLENSSFYAQLYVNEGEEWGKIIANGYERHENGEPIINPNTGSYQRATNVDHGSILPDWNGGFRANLAYRNFALSAFVEFQKGGQFYSITKLFNNYSGLGAETVGNNSLGNPMRDPVVDQDGEPQTTVPIDQAGAESGGILVEGVNEEGNAVQYITDPYTHFLQEYQNNEAYIYDASYIKLRSLRLSYNLPSNFMEQLPLSGATVSVHAQNPLLIYSSVDGIDPSMIQNPNPGSFGWWEGGTVPGTRSIGASVNLTF